MPAIVGSVALETPPAIALASPPPLKAITWKTSIIPVTVPSKPNNGANAMHVFINVVFLLIEDFASAKNFSLICRACHEVLSALEFHLETRELRKTSWPCER